MTSFKSLNADIFAVQETKMQPDQAIIDISGYRQFWNSAEKKGYSGTAVFTRIEPLNVTKGIGIDEHDHEGRVITLEFDNYYFITVYTPNSKQQLERLEYRMKWEDDFRKYLPQQARRQSQFIKRLHQGRKYIFFKDDNYDNGIYSADCLHLYDNPHCNSRR